MNRLLPSLPLSLGLFLLWIVLTQAIDPGNLLLGAALAIFWPAATARLVPSPLRLRRPLLLIQLGARVFADMLRSNLAVAGAILGGKVARLPSAFVPIPLELRDPQALAALAMIVTFIPGTVWAQLSADNRTLLLHVLSLEDEATLVHAIKRRYERPLLEVFG